MLISAYSLCTYPTYSEYHMLRWLCLLAQSMFWCDAFHLSLALAGWGRDKWPKRRLTMLHHAHSWRRQQPLAAGFILFAVSNRVTGEAGHACLQYCRGYLEIGFQYVPMYKEPVNGFHQEQYLAHQSVALRHGKCNSRILKVSIRFTCQFCVQSVYPRNPHAKSWKNVNANIKAGNCCDLREMGHPRNCGTLNPLAPLEPWVSMPTWESFQDVSSTARMNDDEWWWMHFGIHSKTLLARQNNVTHGTTLTPNSWRTCSIHWKALFEMPNMWHIIWGTSRKPHQLVAGCNSKLSNTHKWNLFK